jgi:acyl carrier protein
MRERKRMDIRQVVEDYIVENILFGDHEKLDENVSFQESRILDSTGLLDLILFIEERFGIEIGDSEVIPDNFDTLRRMSEFVERRVNERTIAR